MKRMNTIILCLILFLIYGGATALSSMDNDSDAPEMDTDHDASASELGHAYIKVPIGDIELKAPDDITTKRSPVDFPHSKHFTYTCYTCHHTWEGDEPIKTCSSSGCHDQLERPKGTDGKQPDPEEEITYFKEAFHQMCLACHKEIQEQNLKLEMSLKQIKGKLPKGGPTGCVDCHPPEGEE
jgi:hypothetical protein